MPSCTLEQAVDAVLARIEGHIRLGLPLGLGKPNRFANALYQRIKQTPQRELTIYTALSLGRPQAHSELEQRLLGPFVERVFGDYPELDYRLDLQRGELPANIHIEEFYLQPGSLLDSPQAQRGYISLNYSQVARDLDRKGINLVAQLVARRRDDPDCLSLSCNPDITLDLMPLLKRRREAGETLLSVAQVHADLPYMPGDAELPEDEFDLLIEPLERDTLFSTPNMPVSLQDHAIGLHASTLVRDGGTLQIGIGAMGDALSAALLARQADNAGYRAVLEELRVPQGWGELIEREGGLAPFAEGLYGCSEMFVLGMLALMEAGVVRRPVYADARLQRMANLGALDAHGRPRSLGTLVAAGLPARITPRSLLWLQRHGLLDGEVRLERDGVRLPDGRLVSADLNDRASEQALSEYLGQAAGVLVHGGFFLGPQAFYERLRQMSHAQRQRVGMTGIGFINRLYGDEELKRLQRRDARFINSAFTVTLLGAGVADQLEDGRVLSGVGGQYDFFAQAHELEGARSILMLRAWRESGGEASSNIVWQYGHTTIPRHLRDIVVTEYGIADLRGKNDEEVIKALLRIADSRFQDALIEQAQKAGKLSADFQLDWVHRQNTPWRLLDVQSQHPRLFAEYPLGCDFTAEEQALLRALRWLKSKLKLSEILELGMATLFDLPEPAAYAAHLERMGLEKPEGLREQLYQKLVLAGLKATAQH
ncbi:acetyl-CoA hydrolase/transferase family protein [Pseudomonas kuykendallii]|uniref:Acetyl-CoA hydrolase/transferase C-terminal domain-containing protein n=1 Tax=Pseudomonas kuykendallii TaxID=1007099 RepID=A0A1H2S1P5_9PSED|nr:acetyl-CoA hydrolase/transferase C-terminal domain-containing protein [Pseudomonas kuykendallii]MCQ4270391.1 acetyl-CoA hydrolase/transferase family protein [Pseudomonas kuykendallii]SDW25410.1 Acetyl-CoA hydrolase/transferase C-terminal domain-containing protein [Pseudomonas kuykendallii]